MNSRTEYNNPDDNQFLGFPYHYEMLSDQKRVKPFRQAIEQVCKGKIVLESGTGSGVLSILAAKAGAKKVFAVEIDPQVARFARDNIAKNHLQDTITLLQKDTRAVTINDLEGRKAQVFISENLSTWQVTEPQISVNNYSIDNLLEEGAIHIPEGITNCLELTESQFYFEDCIELRTHFFEFTGVLPPKPLSEVVIFHSVDLNQVQPSEVEVSKVITVNKSGILNSLRLTSPVQVGSGFIFTTSDSLMPPVVIPLAMDLPVQSGDRVRVSISYKYEMDWNQVICHAELE